MKIGYAFNEAAKNSEGLLREIIEQHPGFGAVEGSAINEILQVFKIADNGLMDRQAKVVKIKQKLLDVIVDEKDECVNYLILPKFNNLSEQAKAALKEVITSTWTTYLRREAEEEKTKKCSVYFCRGGTLKQTEEFHLGLFNMFRSFYFYQNPSFYPMMSSYPPMMAPRPAESFPAYQEMQNPQLQAGFYSMPLGQSLHPQEQPESRNNIKIEDRGEMSDIYLKDEASRARKKSKKKAGEREEGRNKLEKDSSSHPNLCKSFSGCVCKGKLGENERYFECEECERKFHLSCLHIPTNAVEKAGVHKKCPQCYLKNNNSLYQTIEELEMFWSDDRELHKQKITIKSKKSKEIQEKKYSIQLRFMKIEGRTMYDWDIPGLLKLEPGLADKPIKPILNEVLLKDEVITKGNGEDVKISLDYMKGPEVRSEDRKPVLLFVALNIVQQKSVQQILEGSYEYFEEDYLDRFMKDRDQLKIEIFDINFKLFNKPVRGSDCQHSDLYDLEEFANHCIDLHNDLCFCCSKRCRTFKIDGKVEAEIKKIKQTIPREEDYPQAIYYQKDGTFKWRDERASQEPMEPDNDNGNVAKVDPAAKEEEDGMEEEQFSSLSMSEVDNQDEGAESEEEDSSGKGAKGKRKGTPKMPKTARIKKKNKQ